jgi:ribA/ribD-fused uncharacterized protein
MAITEFRGKYGFLSNFWPATIEFEGVTYPSVENAYMASKTLDPLLRVQFQTCSSKDAKAAGRQLVLRPGWNEFRLYVMRDLVWQKFVRHPELKQYLMDTGEEEIIEGNYWHDYFWGVCNGKGENHLGKILMETRETLREMEERG